MQFSIQSEDTPIADNYESSQGAHAYDQGMEASEGIADARAFIRSDQPSQRNKGSHTVADPISPSDMDPWVYEYSKDNTNSQTQWHDLKHKPSEYATAQKSKKDIGGNKKLLIGPRTKRDLRSKYQFAICEVFGWTCFVFL